MAADIPGAQFGEFIKRIGDRIASTRPQLMRKIKQPVLDQIEANYDNASTAYGNRWPKRRAKNDDGHPLLILTGRMKAASISKTATGDHIEEMTDDEFTFGLNPNDPTFIYPVIHNDGLGDMPQREFYAVNDKTVDQMAEMVADDLLKLFME
jgi:phage gpG-like protein